MSKIIKIIIGVVILFISLVILGFSYYSFQLTPPSSDKNIIDIEIPKGSNGSSIATILKDKGLIRDETVFRAYLKVHKVNNISYGVYELSKSMGVKKIVDIISAGDTKNLGINILFKEGKNMRVIAKTIAENTNNDEEDVYDLLKDETYLDELISKYWFLTDDIKNPKLYYPLEGYLAPNTYQFDNKDVSIKDIFKTMLDQTNKILTPYKDEISNSNFTVHEFITLASIVENEGVNDDDRPTIASVFYNRLDAKMSFGSCATACYAAKFDGACVPKNVNTSYNSPYNTYLPSMIGLPVGPISNPGLASIKAALNPTDTDYYYFLADKNKKTYFTKSGTEHLAKKSELIKAGLWYE